MKNARWRKLLRLFLRLSVCQLTRDVRQVYLNPNNYYYVLRN
jgi:hypothetical protein